MKKRWDNYDLFCFGLACFGLSFELGAIFSADKHTSFYHEKAIKNNCAQYSPTTGSFEWIEKEKAE